MSRQSQRPRHSGGSSGRRTAARKAPGGIPERSAASAFDDAGGDASAASATYATYATYPGEAADRYGERVDETVALGAKTLRGQGTHDVTVPLPTALTGAPSRGDEPEPVFVDSSGGRRRLLRKLGWLLGVASLGYAVVLGISLAGGNAGAPDVLIPGPDKKASDKVDPSPSRSGKPSPDEAAADPTPGPTASPSDVPSTAPAGEGAGGGAETGRTPVSKAPAGTPQDKPTKRPTKGPSKPPPDSGKPPESEDPPPDAGDPDPGDPDPGDPDPGENPAASGGVG